MSLLVDSNGQKFQIVAIEDEEDIAELVRYNLESHGFQVQTYTKGEEGLAAIQQSPPSLLILDLMLPGLDGLEICRRIRKNQELRRLPIVMVTAKGEEDDIVRGLELGADDYITKPFSPKVLVARVEAVLRRGGRYLQDEKEEDEGMVQRQELTIHPGRREVLLAGEPIDLTPSEFAILHYLAQRPGWVFTRSQIVDRIRGEKFAVTERSIDVQIVGLRKKLGKYDSYVETVRGVGYRFRDQA